MNTPAHAVLNLVLLGRRRPARAALPILLGAVLPDLSMFLFYAIEKWVLARPERIIWSQDYFSSAWQNFFDTLHSLPLFGLLFLAALRSRARGLALLCASVLLHILCDLPLHHDDAHRHLFPLSDWRFRSPLSYWNPRYHGEIISSLEVLCVLVGCALLLRRYRSRNARLAVAALVGSYVAYASYVLWVWG